MRALTIWPEWAYAICHLGKGVENRCWRPPAALIGQRIAIHAGAQLGGRPGRVADQEALLAVRGMWHRAALVSPEPLPRVGMRELRAAPRGAIVATAVLAGARRDSPSPWAVRESGMWHWLLTDVEVLNEPVPCRGAQGLWVVPDELVEVLHG